MCHVFESGIAYMCPGKGEGPRAAATVRGKTNRHRSHRFR